VKTCGSCGALYREDEWKLLPFVGNQDGGEGYVVELRNCPCGSTIGIEFPPSDPFRSVTLPIVPSVE
jgi:hypothetical protein